MGFGQLLRQHLRARSLKQRQFAQAAGLSEAQVSNLLRDRRSPPIGAVERWAKLLQMNELEQKEFIKQAHLSHATAYLRNYIHDLETRQDSEHTAAEDADQDDYQA